MIALQDISDKWINIENVKLKLYPLFINQDGSIVYEEHDHFATNFKHKLMRKINFKPMFINQDTDEKFRKQLEADLNRYKIFARKEEIVIPHIWNYLYGAIPYNENYQAIEEVKNILNGIIIANKNFYLKLKELYDCTNDFNKFHSSITDILNSGIDIDTFLIMFFGLDKTTNCTYKKIITSDPNIYERFWNYILDGYSIEQIPRIINDNGKLYVVNQRQSLEDKECEEELRLIKKEAKPNEYHLFMK